MPVGSYFKGHGDAVMKDMQSRYGDKKGKSVFYATAESRDMKPGGKGKARKAALRKRAKRKRGQHR